KLEEELALERKLGADAHLAGTMANVATVLYAQGDLTAAKGMSEEALVLCRKLDDKECTANSLYGLGSLIFQEGDHAGAGKRLEEARAIREQMGSKGNEAEVRLFLAEVTLSAGDAAKAEALARGAEDGLREAQLALAASARAVLIGALLAQEKRAEAETAAEG